MVEVTLTLYSMIRLSALLGSIHVRVIELTAALPIKLTTLPISAISSQLLL